MKSLKCKIGLHDTGVPKGTGKIVKKYKMEATAQCRRCRELVKI